MYVYQTESECKITKNLIRFLEVTLIWLKRINMLKTHHNWTNTNFEKG